MSVRTLDDLLPSACFFTPTWKDTVASILKPAAQKHCIILLILVNVKAQELKLDR